MNVAEARACFPGLAGRVFLDAASISLMPAQAGEALHKLTDSLLYCNARDTSQHHINLDLTAGQARRAVAALVHATPDDVALVESTTHALEIVAATVPLQRGDSILVGETEFLGLAVPWIPRRQTEGIEIVTVPARDGRLLAEEYEKAITPRTRMILLSSVQWSNGFRVDLASFSDLAKRREVLLVVDAIQGLGAMPLDVTATPVDFLVCGGHKWLNAPAGRGFLYASPRVVEQFRAPAWGYLNIRRPPEGWAAYFATPTTPAVRDYDFARTARKFEVGGTSNYPGNTVLAASVNLINALGPEPIARHIHALTARLIDRLQAIGCHVVSPPREEERSGILSFTLGQGAERDRQVLHALWDRKVVISQRYTAGVGGLRVSVHFFNNADDIDQLLDAVREFRD